MAYKRLCNTEKRLAKDKSVAESYDHIFSEYLEKGYIQKILKAERDKGTWYLPHFPVIIPDRTTTKVRIVFDASAKHQGISLNDSIHQGSKLQGDLFKILLRFRRYPVALVCDVAEMYLQIGISPEDRSYFRFLWRSMNVNEKPQVYEFKRVVLGVNASPFLAQYISQENAKRFQDKFPDASETVTKSTYMDDSMVSLENESQAVELYEQLTQLWLRAGMRPRKWLSNSAEAFEQIPVTERALEIDLNSDDLPSVKTLGLVWVTQNDEFKFKSSGSLGSSKLTKRDFLRETARLFEPIGFLAPFHIRANIIMQEIWLSGAGWDYELAPDLKQKAVQWFSEIPELEVVRIPRCLQLKLDLGESYLHIFVDASKDAYGAIVYDVASYKNGDKSSRLVASKSRVALLKSVSIPRLELMAAVLGVKLVLAIVSALALDLACVVLWTDSQNVLFWIKNHGKGFKTFVAHRISFIQEHTEPDQWMYIPSKLNVADLLSRGTTVSTLTTKTWMSGPSFLESDENDWPEQPVGISPPDNPERAKVNIPTVITMMTILYTPWRLDPTRYSDWKKLIRVIAWVYRFLSNSQCASELRQIGELAAEEIEDAERLIISQTQREVFAKEVLALYSQKPLPSSSTLLSLNPFIDDDGILRCGGRLQFANVLPYGARFPIILPRRHWVTKLIVRRYHEEGKHVAGTNHILACCLHGIGSFPDERRYENGRRTVPGVVRKKLNQVFRSWLHFQGQG